MGKIIVFYYFVKNIVTGETAVRTVFNYAGDVDEFFEPDWIITDFAWEEKVM